MAVLISNAGLDAQSLSEIQDTVVLADGSLFNGKVVIVTVPPDSDLDATSVSIRNGLLDVFMAPTSTLDVPGSYYSANYLSTDGSQSWTEQWQFGPGKTPLKLSDIRQSPTPTQCSGQGDSQTATLPIPISDVLGLSADLGSLAHTIDLLGNGSVDTSSLQLTVSGLNTTVSSLATTVSGLQTSFSSLSSSVNSTSVQLAKLQTGLSGLGTNQSNDEATINALNSQVSLLAQANTLNQSAIAALKTSLNTISSQLTNTVQSLASLTATITSQSTPKISFVDREIPAGTKDGLNTTFSLSAAPNPASSLCLFRNGILLTPQNDYNLNGLTIVFTSVTLTPQSTDSLVASYRE